MARYKTRCAKLETLLRRLLRELAVRDYKENTISPPKADADAEWNALIREGFELLDWRDPQPLDELERRRQ